MPVTPIDAMCRRTHMLLNVIAMSFELVLKGPMSNREDWQKEIKRVRL